jgi:hypothetical protein
MIGETCTSQYLGVPIALFDPEATLQHSAMAKPIARDEIRASIARDINAARLVRETG